MGRRTGPWISLNTTQAHTPDTEGLSPRLASNEVNVQPRPHVGDSSQEFCAELNDGCLVGEMDDTVDYCRNCEVGGSQTEFLCNRFDECQELLDL